MGTTPDTTRLALQRALIEAWLAQQDSAGASEAYRLDLASFGRWCGQHGAIPLNANATALTALRIARENAGNSALAPQLTPEALATYRAQAAALDPCLDALVALLALDGLATSEALARDATDRRDRGPTVAVTVRRRGESRRVVLHLDRVYGLRRCAAGQTVRFVPRPPAARRPFRDARQAATPRRSAGPGPRPDPPAGEGRSHR